MSRFHLTCRALIAWAAFIVLPARGAAQTIAAVEPTESTPPAAEARSQPVDKRIFGVLPNYRTADGSAPFEAIASKRKFYIAAKDSFDYPVVMLSAVLAGFYQLEDQDASFGQGVKGYAKRIATSYADQAVGNMMSEAIFPSLLHEDPRYFRMGAGDGSNWRRTRYAVTRVLVVRTDQGKWRFNSSEWLGNGATVAISNLYYPSDTRNVTDNVQKLGLQIGTDALSQVLKEFWLDWKRKFFKKKS